jgi:hypothetical protein
MPATVVLVNNQLSLQRCLCELTQCHAAETRLAISANGVALGPYGTISVLSIYPEGGERIYLVDFLVMGSKALERIEPGLKSLLEILESPHQKVRHCHVCD